LGSTNTQMRRTGTHQQLENSVSGRRCRCGAWCDNFTSRRLWSAQFSIGLRRWLFRSHSSRDDWDAVAVGCRLFHGSPFYDSPATAWYSHVGDHNWARYSL